MSVTALITTPDARQQEYSLENEGSASCHYNFEHPNLALPDRRQFHTRLDDRRRSFSLANGSSTLLP